MSIILFILLFPPPAVLAKDIGSGENDASSPAGVSVGVGPARRNQRGINDSDGDVILPSEDMFCGVDWLDASRECHEPCPTGYDAECSKSEWTCQWYTGCAAKLATKSESEVSSESDNSPPVVTAPSNDTVVSCLDCQNDSKCVYREDGTGAYCDCSTATAGPNEDGILCKHCIAWICSYHFLICCSHNGFENNIQSCSCRRVL